MFLFYNKQAPYRVSNIYGLKEGSSTTYDITLVQPHTSITDNQGFYYAFASYWLVNNGNTYFSEQEITDDYNDPSPWREEYSWNFGKATGNYTQLENGL
ncbi:putative glycoside hydrolase [Maribacter sp. IgM3_T14_3]|uniref:putative glycoside hydrolase n=1 Tax=Maribacter sp. IgM3_T14_3 TaxID=3415140 RepID=UPI003C6EE859